MLTFNDLLAAGGIDPAEVLMLRHKLDGGTALDIWRSDRSRFEAFQSRQAIGRFDRPNFVATFLVDHTQREVFGGLYGVGASHPTPIGSADPVTGHIEESGKGVIYELTVVSDFGQYEDRLVIQWYTAGIGPGWFQWAHRNEKPVIEITAQIEQPFPGWLEFRSPVDVIDQLPRTWREVLRVNRGVYLLTDTNGVHYVGSAKGDDGFLGRWDAYRGGRSGGNIGLRDAEGPFTVAVLATFDGSVSENTIESVESHWKTKLGAREVGHNRN